MLARRSFFSRIGTGLTAAVGAATLAAGGATVQAQSAGSGRRQPRRHSRDNWLDELPGRAKWEARCYTEQQLIEILRPHGFDLIDAREVLEGTESYAKSADWVERMRDADSLLTALSDDQIAEGVRKLRSTPTRMGRVEVTMFVFEQR